MWFKRQRQREKASVGKEEAKEKAAGGSWQYNRPDLILNYVSMWFKINKIKVQ